MSKEDYARTHYYKMKGYKKHSEKTKAHNNWWGRYYKEDSYHNPHLNGATKIYSQLNERYQYDFDLSSSICRKAPIK